MGKTKPRKIKVRPDLATYKSIKQKVAEFETLKQQLESVEKMIDPIDFNEIDFDNDIETEFHLINFSLISDNAKLKIIEIVRDDYKQQTDERLKTAEKLTVDQLSYRKKLGDITLTTENDK